MKHLTLSIHTVYDTKVNNVKRHAIRRVMLVKPTDDIQAVIQSQILNDETLVEYSLHDCGLTCEDKVCNMVSGLEVI